MARVRDGAETRRQRLQAMLDLIRGAKKIDEKKLKGVFMLKTGLTLPKIEEYLRDLETTGLIDRVDGQICYVD